jgi:hypothetical protein
MLPIPDLAKAIRATRVDFGVAFMQAQAAAGRPDKERNRFEAVVNSPDNVTAFEEALRYAQQNNWFNDLIDAILANRLDDGRIATSLADATPEAPLQAMINTFAGFMPAHLAVRGLDQAARWTAKITVAPDANGAGESSGTGLLIANNRMLTAWHVVRTLFEADANGDLRPKEDAGARIEVVFSDFMELIGRGNSLLGRGERRIMGHKNWCVFFSRCHEQELLSMLPNNLAELEGFWDYAIIRLAEPIGFERGWVNPDDRAVVPRPKDQIVLLQHPGGRQMRLAFNDIASPLPQQQTVIPRLRFLHLLNSLPGSSGGPCFDKTFTFFGFHQGAWNGSNPVTNRGVPIAGVLKHLKDNYGVPRLEPEESLIWKLGEDKNNAPVIGGEEFQNVVLDSPIIGKLRIFTIRGNEGSGKTFHASLVSALLPDVGHLKIELNAQAIATKPAAELADMISTRAGAGTLQLAAPSEVFSTDAVWLKDEVTQKLIEAIDRVRNDRLVWLIITDLNAFDLQSEQAAALLLLIYEQVKIYPWLRIVLDGSKINIPGGLSEFEYRHRVGDITRPQIETYLRRLTTFLGLDPAAVGIPFHAISLFKKYDDEAGNNPKNAARLLAETIMKDVIPIFYEMKRLQT